MAEDKIRIPSGQGGLTRFDESTGSRLQFSPGLIIVMCVAIILIIAALHYLGGKFLA